MRGEICRFFGIYLLSRNVSLFKNCKKVLNHSIIVESHLLCRQHIPTCKPGCGWCCAGASSPRHPLESTRAACPFCGSPWCNRPRKDKFTPEWIYFWLGAFYINCFTDLWLKMLADFLNTSRLLNIKQRENIILNRLLQNTS